MGTIKAVVFDLDGTLVNSAPDLHTAINKLLAANGRQPVSLDQLIMMIGDGAATLVERAFAATGGEPAPSELPELTSQFLAFYEGHSTELTRPYPGVSETLAELKANGLALGVCTNKPAAATHEVLRNLDLDGFFDAVLGGDSIDGARKPDPRMLQGVLDSIGVDASRAVMVGDAVNDVGVARALNVQVIIVGYGYTRIPVSDLGADMVIAEFSQLTAALAHLP